MHHALSLSIIRGRCDVVTRFILLLSADAYAMQLCKQGLERDDFSSNRHPALCFCLSMISGQTLRVCPEGKPVPTPHQVRGRLFPDHALEKPPRKHTVPCRPLPRQQLDSEADTSADRPALPLGLISARSTSSATTR